LPQLPHAAAGPLAGVRVLDLTRVIAGPVGTRFLAAYGADVVRIDPPGFAEVGALLPETTLGKRCAALDLREPADRQVFERLVAGADVLVGGFRSDAMGRLGYDPESLRALNPDLIVARHDAYGWEGPWSTRRGFDSLVQMSVGITAAGAEAAGVDRPTPLPAQALDHGTGYLHAAAVCRALTRRHRDALVSDTLGSLVGAAGVLTSLPTPDAFAAAAPIWTEDDTVPGTSPWGPLRQAPIPGRIRGIEPAFAVEAGPLGRHEPRWSA
jgi:crotonobetainyl-CoA:carnitine CoA-transferase CaiB-like acyl-CoA transferase